VSDDRGEFLDEDEEQPSPSRNLLGSGWFRAALVLGALAVVMVFALPYVLRWFEPAPRPPATAQAPAPSQTPQPAAPPPPATAPAALPTEPARPAPGAERGTSAPRPREAVASRAGGQGTATAARPPEGQYWVQVGAFREEGNAQRLAATLRSRTLHVEVARVERVAAGGDRHQLLVTGSSLDAVARAIGNGRTARAVAGGIAVEPALPLKEAVALSRRLAADGLAVKIQRVAGQGAEAAQHLVRVGAFPTRARAGEARRELAAQGIAGFVTRGPAR
jgi:cell division protein FtsN